MNLIAMAKDCAKAQRPLPLPAKRGEGALPAFAEAMTMTFMRLPWVELGG